MVAEPDGLTLRYIADQLKEYRNETRDARHEQNNRFAGVIGDLRHEFEVRMRAIEMENAASSPTTLGPRLQKLERWQGALDENEDGGAPKRISAMEARWDRMDGSIAALRAIVAILSVVNVGLGIVVAILALT